MKDDTEITPLRLEVDSETSDWAASWTGDSGVAKSFYVRAYGENNTLASGVAISISADSTLKGEMLGTPITNSVGTATCRVLIASQDADTGDYITFCVTDSKSISESFLVAFYAESLPAVRCIPALDGLIDDADYASGDLIATLSSTGAAIDENSLGVLYWGQNAVESNELVNHSYFKFDLNGRDDLFQNQTLQYRGLIISPDGNGSYSKSSTVLIERENGGAGFPYLTGAVSIPQATSGYINRAMATVGVDVLIENGDIKSTDSSTDETILEDYLNSSDVTLILNMIGEDRNGNVINHLRYNVNEDPDSVVDQESDGSLLVHTKDIVTTEGTDIGANFFTNLGEGRVYLNLSVTYQQTPYSLREILIKSYDVDVVPPGV